MTIEALRNELETLLKDLAKVSAEGDSAGEKPADAAGAPQAVEDDKAGEYTNALQKLSDYLAGTVDDAEETLAAHPFVSVGAAFLLGIAVGRLSRN